MKKIITLVLILLGFKGISQTPYPTPYTQQGSPSTLVQVRGGWKADSTAMMPKYVDTITANLYKTKLYAGSIIFTTSDGNYWYRSADAARWLLFGNSVTNCLGTQLISGSITWSGSGLIFDATDLDYSIICTRYSSSATTLTLSTADPTYARIDKLYADITGNVGVITGTPAPNPQEPVINPLSQLDMGIVYIPAGSTVPAGTTQTVIYNENVEWSGTSDVPSVNFDYATNPYIGSLSTYLPSAPNSSYVEWQSNGIDYLFSEAQYLKFWVRLNDNFVSDPLSFLDVTFEYTDVTVSQTLAVGNGDYNMDYSLINQWQLVSIPLTGITTYGTEFNSVHFVINSAPTSFQLDYVYLLETATVPPVISSGWSLNLNTGTNPTTNGIGTSDSVALAMKTNSQTRLIIPANGIVELSNDELDQQLLTIRNDTIYKTNIPTAYGTLPIVVEVRNDSTFITCPTCDTIGSNWSLTGNNVTTGQFLGSINDADVSFKHHSVLSGLLNSTDTHLGFQSGIASSTASSTAIGSNALSSVTGSSRLNAAIGSSAGQNVTTGIRNFIAGSSAGLTLVTGGFNTIAGYQSDVAASSTDSSGAFGYAAVATTKQMAFSPYFNTMFLDLDSASGTAPAIAGIDENGNWRKYATPSGGSSQWKDTTAGIYYADKVGIGGVINPGNALTVIGSATVGTAHSNAGTNNFISGSGSTVGIGGNNIIAGSDHAIANNQGGNAVFGETQTLGNAEASSIIYGYGNAVGDNANDALVGGTGSSIFGAASIALGVGNSTTAEESISIGGGNNSANAIYSGTFAGVNHEAEDSAAVVIGGQNNSASGVNAAIIGGENNATLARNTVILGGSSVVGTMANTTYVDSLRVGGKIVAPNLPTSGTYSKSLAIDASGNIYKKDTAALTVSNLGGLGTGVGTLLAATPTGTTSLVGSASPTITGVLTANVISATGVVATTSTLRSGTSSPIEHAASNRFTASSNGFENLTSSFGTANTANLSVGSLRTGYVAKTANYTATAFDETISCSTNAFTITLPTAVGCAGQKYNITNSTAANTITIGTTSSQVFGNVTATPTTLSLIGLGAVIVVSDGANWLQLK